MYATLRITTALEHLKGIFADTPATQLSVDEAAQLSALDDRTCRLLLEALEDVRFLTRGANGLFTRRETDLDDLSA